MTASRFVRSLRQQAGLTQADLARRSGLPRTAINAYESGSRVPRFDALSRIAEACGVRLGASVRPRLNIERNARELTQVLDLAEHLPHRRRPERLDYPTLMNS
ncbi:MAG: helix-turn-helix transcriptional regulator [Candidatus Nanopelagicales bacterium]